MTDDPTRPRQPTGAEMALSRERGVSELVRLLASGEYKETGIAAFASGHGVALATAKNWVGEAARQLRAMEQLDNATLRSLLTARLERYETQAEQDGDLNVAVKAALGIAKIEGLERTQQQQAEELAAQWIGVLMEALLERLPAERYAEVFAIVQQVRFETRAGGKLAVRIERA